MGGSSILLWITIFILGAAGQRQCYGTAENNIFACSPNAGVSACCSLGDICFDNGLCGPGPAKVEQDKAKGITYYTPYFLNGCTDASLSSDVCGGFCRKFSIGAAGGVKACTNLGPNVYCCYGGSGCNCTTGNERVFTLGSAAPTAITTLPISTVTSTSTSTSLSTSTTASSASISASTTQPSTSATSASVAAATTTSTTTSTPQSSTNNNNTSLQLGLGLGLGIPLLLALAAGIFFYIRKRDSRAKRPHTPPSAGYMPTPKEMEHREYYIPQLDATEKRPVPQELPADNYPPSYRRF